MTGSHEQPNSTPNIPDGMQVKPDKVRIRNFQIYESTSGSFAKETGLVILGLGSDDILYTYFQPAKIWLAKSA